MTEEKKLWICLSFTSKQLNIFEIISRLRFVTANTKRLEIRGDCTKESIETRPMPNKQTFKEIIKRIVDRSPLLENLSFSNICFDWSREVSCHSISFCHETEHKILLFPVHNVEIPREPPPIVIFMVHIAEKQVTFPEMFHGNSRCDAQSSKLESRVL